MFIRKTYKKDRKTQKNYTTYHLVQSIRTEKGPRQRVILYLGSELGIPDGQLPLLSSRIESLLLGQSAWLIPCPENVEALAQRFVKELVDQQASATQESSPEWTTLDLQSVKTAEPRSVGTEHLLLAMAHQLELPKQLCALGLSKNESKLALATIIARGTAPRSELATYHWLCDRSGLTELLKIDPSTLCLNQLYRISDTLLGKKELLERYLEQKEESFHGYQNTIALYDLTNTYCEGQAASNPKAIFGHSKEKRRDCPLVTLGLVANQHGFLHRSQIFPGNASEPQTLQMMIQSLSTPFLSPPTIILDAGIASEDNLTWLREHQYSYVVCAKQDAPTDELDGPLVPVGDNKSQVKATFLKVAGHEEKWLYCESEAKEAIAASMKQKFRAKFEQELQHFSAGLSKQKKKYPLALERLGRLKERYKNISGCYDIQITPSEDGKLAKVLNWQVNQEKMEEKLVGSYLLRTNLMNLDVPTLWGLYNTLHKIEDAFRFMKSSLGLRPIYHQKEHRVDGHLWITILAYHLMQHCLYQLQEAGICYHWQTVRDIMGTRDRVTIQASVVDGRTLSYRCTTEVEHKQREIYRALGLSPQILKKIQLFL
jgi:transposase